MDVSAISSTTSLAQSATQMKAEQANLVLSVAVFKQIQESQNTMGQAIVDMIVESKPQPANSVSLGKYVNIKI